MNALRSILYAAAFYFGSVFYVASAALMIPLGGRAVFAIPRAWSRYQGAIATLILGNRLRVEGVLPQGAVIVALKHESFFETFAVLRLFDRPAVVLKAELLEIPLWGRVAKAQGVIPVARETGAAALRAMLKAARAAHAAGRPIIIFPEGTRVPHGTAPPLRPGIAGLYKALDVPIVPVAVDSGRLWGWRSFWKRPGPVTFRVGTVIPPGLPRDDIEARVHAGINALNPHIERIDGSVV